MLCLEGHRFVADRMSAIDAVIRTWPERFNSDAKFATDEVAYDILEIGRGVDLETLGQLSRIPDVVIKSDWVLREPVSGPTPIRNATLCIWCYRS